MTALCNQRKEEIVNFQNGIENLRRRFIPGMWRHNNNNFLSEILKIVNQFIIMKTATQCRCYVIFQIGGIYSQKI